MVSLMFSGTLWIQLILIIFPILDGNSEVYCIYLHIHAYTSYLHPIWILIPCCEKCGSHQHSTCGLTNEAPAKDMGILSLGTLNESNMISWPQTGHGNYTVMLSIIDWTHPWKRTFFIRNPIPWMMEFWSKNTELRNSPCWKSSIIRHFPCWTPGRSLDVPKHLVQKHAQSTQLWGMLRYT